MIKTETKTIMVLQKTKVGEYVISTKAERTTTSYTVYETAVFSDVDLDWSGKKKKHLFLQSVADYHEELVVLYEQKTGAIRLPVDISY